MLPYMVDRLRESDVSIYDHAPTAMEEDPYADSGIYEAIVHKIKVRYFPSRMCVCVCVCRYTCV